MMIYPWWKFGVCHQELIMNMISPIHTISASCISVPIDVLTISTELLMTSPASQMTGPIPCGKQINHVWHNTPMSDIQIHIYAKVHIPHNILNQSAISIRFSDSLGSFKPSRQLAAVCHGCARITEAAVTVVPGYGHGCTRITNTRNRDTVSAISVHMLPNWHRNVNERNNTVSGPFNMTNRGTCTFSNTDSPLQ